ncbi:Uu.00g087530.m01.CDS01 [Anthostomella pinea]|uniref:Uu.00g087530.m01.CDS01 n=1 Tax=Anthostomella pinea TaxID=933095 RepID=A0AAI8VMZ2_9PEZI|nr:Uu.00g087530.m01.CDS01 [Anthostomella pinea]
MALSMKPLDLDSTLNEFQWLLEGLPSETRTLHDRTMQSSRLLHFSSQTTYFAAKMAQKSSGSFMMIIPAAEELLDQRADARQRSPFRTL